MKLNIFIITILSLFLCYSCTTMSEKQICPQIQNQYWIDLDTTSVFIAFFEGDSVFIKSSELGFLQQYQKCENNILYSFYDKELSDTLGIQKLRMIKDTLILEVISNDFVRSGYISKMRRTTKDDVDKILSSYFKNTTVEINDTMIIEAPRID